MAILSLLFGKPVYKKYTNGYNWFIRENGCLSLFIVFALFLTAMVVKNVGNFALYAVFVIVLYKAMTSLRRLLRRSIPVFGRNAKIDFDTPFEKVNIAVWVINIIPFAPIGGRVRLEGNELALHRKQQIARSIFYVCVLLVLGVFTFK